MGTRFIEGFTFNFFSVYLLAYVVTNLELPRSLALGGVMAGAALGVLLVPVTGALSDRVGRKPVYRVGAWLALVIAFPVAALVQSANPVAVFAVFVAGLGVLYGTVYGPLAAFWSELFDTRYRYTALSTLYQVSGIVASGLTPLIAAWLVSQGRRQPLAGGGLQRARRGDQPGVRAVPARDPGPGPRCARRGPADALRGGGPPAGVSRLSPAPPGDRDGSGGATRRSPTSPGTSGPRSRPPARGRPAARR